MGNNRYIPAADPALAQAIAQIQNRDRKDTTGGKGNTSFYDSIKKNESSRPIGLNYNSHIGLYIGLPPDPPNYKLEGMIPFLDDAKNYEPGSVSFEGLPQPGVETKTSIYQDVLDLYERNNRFQENVSLSDLSDYLNKPYTFEKPFTDDESFAINESYKPWLMHPQEELGLAVDAFTDINEAYDEYQAKERLTKEDITAINQIISELDSMYIADSNDQSLSYQLANDFVSKFRDLAKRTGSYVLYPLLEFGAGATASTLDTVGDVRGAIGNLFTGGEYSDGFHLLEEYFAKYPKARQSAMQNIGNNIGLAYVLDISPDVIDAYLQSTTSDYMQQYNDATFGYGLNQTYKDFAGDLAYFAGYLTPDILMSLAMPGVGAGKAGSYIDDATKASSKYYDDLIEYWRAQFNNGGKAASGMADEAVAYADDLVYNGENWIFNRSSSGDVIENALPYLDNAIINSKKIYGYALNPEHTLGGGKSYVIEHVLGYNKSNADDLVSQIFKNLSNNKAILGKLDDFGQRFTVDMQIIGVNGNIKILRTGWIIDTGSTTPRLTTLYIK